MPRGHRGPRASHAARHRLLCPRACDHRRGWPARDRARDGDGDGLGQRRGRRRCGTRDWRRWGGRARPLARPAPARSGEPLHRCAACARARTRHRPHARRDRVERCARLPQRGRGGRIACGACRGDQRRMRRARRARARGIGHSCARAPHCRTHERPPSGGRRGDLCAAHRGRARAWVPAACAFHDACVPGAHRDPGAQAQ